MGLMQDCIETYDKMGDYEGVYQEGKEPLAPIGHIITKAQIEITIDYAGNFISASAVDKKIIIPVTEESAGRTSAPVAHPLCDGVGYFTNDEKRSLFLNQLKDWCDSEFSDNKIRAVYRYVNQGKVKKDLQNCGLIKYDNGKSDIIKNDKDTICWRVIGTEANNLHEDRNLMRTYQAYYLNCIGDNRRIECFLSGRNEVSAKQHLKGVVAVGGNAKIISSNDNQNFTYKGRFFDDAEAVSISYLSSQKAHNALKWIAGNQGVRQGDRLFICWNPSGIEVPKVNNPFIKRTSEQIILPSDYKNELQKYVNGYKAHLPVSEKIIIAALEAATSGRLAVTYYNKMNGSDFLDRLSCWDETCCWFDADWGTYSPSLYEIINCTYGYQRGNDDNSKIEVDEKIIGQHMQRLIACRVDKARIPKDLVRNIVEKANNLQIYNKANRHRMLFTACAVINKYRKDYYKEEYLMALEPDKKDRSYQYGRLLAILDTMEKRELKKRKEDRDTNAMRMQTVFTKRPAYTFKLIMEQLKNSVYPRLTPASRNYYDKLIGEVMEQISAFGDTEYNRPLNETYLLGYYLQCNAFYVNNKENQEENKDVDITE